MKTLVIAEKPSVARDIARVLGCSKKENGALEGNKYIVTWALGHLVTLKDPEDYDKKYKEWNMAVLPMMPEKLQIKVIPQTGKQYHAVTTQLARKDVNEIVIATDAGREGELVARWILDKAHNQKPCKRLWISSVTDKAIREGFANLKDAKEYDNLYRAAVSRAEADWLVGINATRALTCKYNAQLSCGRVQTPTLAMIAQREQEIREFVPKPYYTVTAAAGGVVYTWKDEKSGGTRISDPEKAKQIAEKAKRYPLVLQNVEKKKKQKEAPLLYDLTELQRDASARFGYSAKQTLNLMQSLYETHKVLTYPRTDSRYLTKDIVPTLKERLDAVSIGPYKALAQQAKRSPLNGKLFFVNDAKVSDHHAIIPTEQYVQLSALSNEERRIYDLVVRRFLAVLLPPCVYEETVIQASIEKECFTARGKRMVEKGWQEAYEDNRYDEEDEAKEEVREQNLPLLEAGMKIGQPKISLREGKTKPPARFTEGTLLSAMETAGAKDMPEDAERRGLGTPATRAAVIEKLVATGFAERKKAKKSVRLVPTEAGVSLITVLPEQLQSPLLTAEWEHRLKEIECGELGADEFLAGICDMVAALVRDAAPVDGAEVLFPSGRPVVGKCPRCGAEVTESKNGYFCERRSCKFGLWRDNRFLAAKKISLTKKMASSLLTQGRAYASGIYSEKTGKTYDAFIVLEDDGARSSYKLDFTK